MLLLFLPEYFEMFCIYYLYCSCKISPLTHFIVAFRAKCKIFSRHLQKPILKTEKGRFKGL